MEPPDPAQGDDEVTEAMAAAMPDVELTPEEHARFKARLFTAEFRGLKRFDERYLVCGSGGDGAAASRRDDAYDLLAARDGATAFRLEDFGFTDDDLDLWWRAFDVLCGRATTIVVVLEDFHGGYASEMAYLWTEPYRSRTWLLQRVYDDEATMRAKYDDPMARSCSIAFARLGRVLEWSAPPGFRQAVERVP